MTFTYLKRKSSQVRELGIKYTCNSCHADISNVIRIKCAECSEIDLCSFCFSHGVEMKPSHLKTHSYHVIEPFSFALFDRNWRADEELLLIEAALSVGLGNWTDISDFIGTKDAAECETHYFDLYINSPEFPYPDSRLYIANEKTPIEISNTDKQMRAENTPTLVSHPSNHEISGYMTLREEFETEYLNDAENTIKDLAFNSSDSPIEHDLKLAMLYYYNHILDKRAERRRFVIDHSFIDYKKHLQLDKHRSEEEKQVYQKLFIFERFLSVEDFNELVAGYVREIKLQKQILQLQEYRKNGIRDFETAQNFENKIHLIRPIPFSSSSHGGSGGSQEPSFPLKSPSKNTALLFSPSVSKIENTSSSTSGEHSSSVFSSTTPKAPTVKRSLGLPLDISEAEGFELLSNSERNMCSILRIIPKTYLSIKETLIAACNKFGYLKRAQARALIKIDVNKTSRLYDFFISAGWIKASCNASAPSSPTIPAEEPANSESPAPEMSTHVSPGKSIF